ncbi:MAG: hypothetical protein M3O15_08225 [Acidobacteriota bacterium]|nr:hypothetical protein [Acidobacteriota bacterium]
MGILNGTISVTRCNVVVPPEGPDFERAEFRAIEPESEVRERYGFVPFELDAPYEVGKGRYALRIRIDRLRPDPTSVRERVRELVKVEMETTGAPFVGAKARKRLRELAEQELLRHQAPRSKIIECAIDGSLLYIGSTAKNDLGLVLTLLRQAGVAAEWKAPWLDEAPEADETSDIVTPGEAGQSVLGCRFLKALLEEPEVMVEPETGSVRLATHEARVTLSGGVLRELFRYIEEGAEILSAKLLLGPIPLRFDALSYRIASVKLEPVTAEHWTLALDARLEQIAALWETLDEKYAALRGRLGGPPAAPAAAVAPEVEPVEGDTPENEAEP